MVNLKPFVPKGSFIHDYMLHMKDVETPAIFDFWCAVWLIGLGVGDTVYVDRPRNPVRLNWYLLLTSAIGTSSKPLAVTEAAKVAKEIYGTLDSGITRNKLVEQIVREGSLTICTKEFISIVGKKATEKSVIETLTSSYSYPENVCMLSSATPDWIYYNLDLDGPIKPLLSQMPIVVSQTKPRPIVWPKESDYDIRTFAGRLRKFREFAISQNITNIPLSPTALHRLSNWYRTRPIHSDAYQSSFELNEDTLILKLSASLCINDGLWEIQSSHIRYATNLILECKRGGHALFGRLLTKDSHILKGINKTREVLTDRSENGIRHTDLYRMVISYLNLYEFRLLMVLMHEVEMVQVFESGKRGGRMYRGTDKLADKVVYEKVIQDFVNHED